MSDYTGRHHETRIGVHRKSSNTVGYKPRHSKGEIELAIETPGRRRGDIELAVHPPTRQPRRTPSEPVAKVGYTGQHTRKPKSQTKRANATARANDRKFGAGPAGFFAALWRLGK